MGWTVYNSDGQILQSAGVSDNAITTAKILDDAVTADKLANSINTLIADNTAKTGITSGQASAITANTAKVTNATHTGDVTGATALTIAAGAVDMAMLATTAGTAGSGTFLRGDGQWQAAGGGAIAHVGDDTGSTITNSTSAGSISGIMSVTIAATLAFNIWGQARKDHVATADGSIGMRLVTGSGTVTVDEPPSSGAGIWVSAGAGYAQDGIFEVEYGTRATNFLGCVKVSMVSRRSSNNTNGNSIDPVTDSLHSALTPTGTITGIQLTGRSGSSSNLLQCTDIHIYTMARS